jgi:deoxyribonuclease I
METLKQHWKTITLTVVITSLLVGAAGLTYGIYTTTKQPAAATQFTETTDLKIKGNRSSKIYHLPNCPNYNDISERNIVWFKTQDEAQTAGYRVAKNCP